MHRVSLTGTDAGLFLPLPIFRAVCPRLGLGCLWPLERLCSLRGSPPLSVPRTRPINTPRHVHPNTGVYLKTIWWLVYADGVHIECSSYSPLPSISHPPLPAQGSHPSPPHPPRGHTGRGRKTGEIVLFTAMSYIRGFTLPHYEVNPSSSCQTWRSFFLDCVTCTLRFTAAAKEKNPRRWQVRMERIRRRCPRGVPRLIRCDVMGLNLRLLPDTQRDRCWQSKAQVRSSRCSRRSTAAAMESTLGGE